MSRGRTRSPSDLVDNHHDLLEVAQHALGDDIVHSLRTDAVPVDKPSAGLQDAARKPDYSGASREGSMSSSSSVVDDSVIDALRLNMHRGPSQSAQGPRPATAALTTAHR